MRFKPKYNQYEVRFLQVLVTRERLGAIIGEIYQTALEELFWQGSVPNTDGEEWLKGVVSHSLPDPNILRKSFELHLEKEDKHIGIPR